MAREDRVSPEPTASAAAEPGPSQAVTLAPEAPLPQWERFATEYAVASTWVEGERRRSRRRDRHDRHLRPGLRVGQRLRLACLILAWGLLTGVAWIWWLQPSHVSSLPTLLLSSGLLALESVLLPVWFYFWIWRLRHPDPALQPPPLRTAMIVTKAPSEPWPIVRTTLEAMLAQDFPLPYDVWLADESPAVETLYWCDEHGVLVSSREGVAEYHRPTWPRRTRCKEGNLAHFYDMWGYDSYDIVAQLDADHVPEPDYLRHITAPFHDPLVGYVAAPSICDRNAASSWSARGRLYAEATLHGPTQAGHSGGYAPSCIGSHYAVRTAALRQIGGLGPELAEDFTTTLMMSSAGWQGVFAIDAEAHGDGPETFADCMTQEFQWSRSMMNVLLGIGRECRPGLSRRARTRLGFCLWWYPLFGLLMLASVLMPLGAIVTRTPLMVLSFGSFWLHFAPPMLVLLATAVWLRTVGWLRPRRARPISWEMALFQLARWPWALLGCAHAVAGRIARREFSFKVTPKGAAGIKPLPARVVLPYLVIAGVSALPALSGLHAGAAHGYYLLATINAVLYAITAVAVVALHVREHPRGLRLRALRGSLGKLALVVMVAAVAAGGSLFAGAVRRLEAGSSASSAPAPAVATGWRGAAAPGGRLAIGLTTRTLASDWAVRWQPADLRQVTEFERQAGVKVGILMWYADWRTPPPSRAQLDAIAGRGAIPEITWEPWSAAVGGSTQPAFALRRIVAGRFDRYIRAWATRLASFGHPIWLRLAQEMNGNWYPWGVGVNGNRPREFVAAWRHVHAIFAAAGARNVRWVWSPVGGAPASLYPGAGEVNILGVTCLNGGTSLFRHRWRSFAAICGNSIDALHRLGPGLPIQISEVATDGAGGSRASWIAGTFADLAHRPEVRSLIWFDMRQAADWTLSQPSALAAFHAGASSIR
ncbi:MAG: glycosyltransferase family 2 protein [Solirubrobacteraceae bacterium]